MGVCKSGGSSSSGLSLSESCFGLVATASGAALLTWKYEPDLKAALRNRKPYLASPSDPFEGVPERQACKQLVENDEGLLNAANR
jgi:hypothetical protein